VNRRVEVWQGRCGGLCSVNPWPGEAGFGKAGSGQLGQVWSGAVRKVTLSSGGFGRVKAGLTRYGW